ncbi:hypothetical protein L916_21701 [Phytophthora nicotianae]|uniref:Uncharacterized protein n=1 Tax=Phytophthora nicotianae TaxID=4792 RepID=W2HSW7_PHYNI|nr:hypothetical protein L916_21701 [Phytophthora nicotianae]
MKRSSEDALDASADHLTCAERWKKIMGRRERDEGRLDSGVTDEDLFEIQFSGNSSDGDSEGDHDDSDTNEESAERLHEPRGETKVMNTATWAQLVSGVGDDASSTVTRETTTVSDGKRPSVDSSASYIATSENESTTTDPEGIHASLKMLDTVAIVRLEPGVKTTPAEEAVVTLDEGYISVAHMLTTEKKTKSWMTPAGTTQSRRATTEDSLCLLADQPRPSNMVVIVAVHGYYGASLNGR